jgi:hypothetical protein
MTAQGRIIWYSFCRSGVLGWSATQFAVLVGLFADKDALQAAPYAVAGLLFSLPVIILCYIQYSILADFPLPSTFPKAIVNTAFVFAYCVSCASLVYILAIYSLLFAIAFIGGTSVTIICLVCILLCWNRNERRAKTPSNK